MAVSRPIDLEDSAEFEVRLDARIPNGVFRQVDGAWEGRLAVTYFLVEDRKFVTVQDQVHLTLNDADYLAALRDGFNFERRIEIPKALVNSILKVVVYQPDKDLLGSIDMRLPR